MSDPTPASRAPGASSIDPRSTDRPAVRPTPESPIPPSHEHAAASVTGPPRWRLALAIALPVLAVVVLVVLAAVVRSRPDPAADAPLALLPVDAPQSGSVACQTVVQSLPDALADLPRRTLDDPPAATVAWGQPPVVFRCGLPDPVELTCSAALQQVNGVAWLPLSDGGQTTYLAVDRSVRIALTLTGEGSSGALLEVSDVIAAALPARDICIGGVLVPTGG